MMPASSHDKTRSAALPRHHPDEAVLIDYATGATDAALNLFVASHLTLCPQCRKRVADAEDVAGTAFDLAEPAAIGGDALALTMALIDGDTTAVANDRGESATKTYDPTGVLPAPLAGLVGGGVSTVRWKPLFKGFHIHALPPVDGNRRAYLLKIAPGCAAPDHGHGGDEHVLVLKGSFSDAAGTFRRGDVEIADTTTHHQPVAGVEEECICLALIDGPIRPSGFFSSRIGTLIGDIAWRLTNRRRNKVSTFE